VCANAIEQRRFLVDRPCGVAEPRPDVVDAREAPWLSDSGFLARVPLELLAPGEYALTLAHGDGVLAAACGEVAFRLSAPARTAVAVE